MNGVRISGLGSAKPDKLVSNQELSKFVETTDEWITTRTGIKSRYISTGETTVELSVRAARAALSNANLEPSEIDLIIVATITPDKMMPSTACEVQSILGANNATSFDIVAACSGFVYATKIAVDAIRVGSNKKALIIGAEVLSKAVDWNDRTTCVLFGDGAGAVIYEQSDVNKILNIYTGSKGSQALDLDHTPINNCFIHNDLTANFIKMDGREVYKFATSVVPLCISKVLEGTGYSLSCIKKFILHQANERILDSVAKKLDIDKDLFFKNLNEYGNTSAASIPIALDEIKPTLNKGDLLILAGFGGGLTWGSILLEW